MHKILIFTPFSDMKALATYPMLQKLRHEFPESEINLLCLAEQGDFFKFLDINLKVYEIPLDDYKLAFMHKFAANLHDVFNINMYIDLSGEFLGAMTGMFFRAEKKYGLHRDFKTKLLFTESVDISHDPSFERTLELMMELFDFEDGGSLNPVPAVEWMRKNRPLKYFFHFEKLSPEDVTKNWIEIANQIYNQQIIFWCDDEKFKELEKSLNKKSEYFNHMGEADSLKRYFKEVDIVFTDKQWVQFVCQSLGTSCFYFKHKSIPSEYLTYFEGTKPIITYDDESVLDIIEGNFKKEIKVVDEVIDFILSKLHEDEENK
ncbi:hypothetical protein M899_1518 [Bacteriovorax sp. BSW11_IV]|uniref:hypothetical protein n=1 Tax=Bacteriovorax sp. BSW11_IV TaxID=1353529 RepID=UPI000389EE43|nr:hypothetical protein [Bacteriovorax sp. BSW11_IV]EQC44433.1 hypothetical protein M899_1518 [Bacteriovorax sp. BSW11_IV]